jgi:poly-gamma-glutamate synthesis protein (capsule biosynthesis protein)
MKKKSLLILFVLLAGVVSDYPALYARNGKQITIAAVGDVMLAHWGEQTLREKGLDYPFSGTGDITSVADIFIGNLEAPITAGGVRDTSKKYTFRFNPELSGVFTRGGFTVFNLANNHMVDFGLEGVKNTIETLDSLDILHCGAGEDWKQARNEAEKEIKGLRFSFLGYSATFPEEFWADAERGGTNFPYAEVIEKDIPRAKKNSDFVVVSIHWGQELRETPKDYQVALAHKFIDLGADLVLGHHPHIVQGIEIYKGVPILYSLGNFTFASYSENAKESMIALITLNKREKKIKKIEIVPINVYNAVVEFNPVPLSGNSKKAFFQKLSELSGVLNGKKIISEAGIINVNP